MTLWGFDKVCHMDMAVAYHQMTPQQHDEYHKDDLQDPCLQHQLTRQVPEVTRKETSTDSPQ